MSFQLRYSTSELSDIAGRVGKRQGWDFSNMQATCDVTPWDYVAVVREYLAPTDVVIDIGTGGGERLLELSHDAGELLGVDPDAEMIAGARQRALEERIANVHFEVGTGEGPQRRFNVVLDRHAPFLESTVGGLLVDGGVFVTQQVGEKNMAAVKAAFNLAPNNVAPVRPETLRTAGFAVERYDEYDVRYTVHDIESLVFWLQALDIAHSDFIGFDATRDVDAVNMLLETSLTPEGVETNAHRYLLVARKLP